MKIIEPSVEIIDEIDTDAIYRKLELCGRVCYKSENRITPESAEKFLKGIIKSGHESVLEHQSITVRLICDRGVSHELVRHRIASYSQESTRYCNYSKDQFQNQISIIDIAEGFDYDEDSPEDLEKFSIWAAAMCKAEEYYSKMLDAGASQQEARSVLPNSVKTEVIMTANIREWRHFFRLRCAKAAHPQMRQEARLLLEQMYGRLPVLFEDVREEIYGGKPETYKAGKGAEPAV